MPGPPFFTNGVDGTSAQLSGAERLPADQGEQSLALTSKQLGDYALQVLDLQNGLYQEDSTNVDFSPAGAEVAGAKLTVLNLTGNLGSDRTLTMPDCIELANALQNPYGGLSYVLRFMNTSASNQKWTIGASGSVSVNGTADVGQNIWREFLVVFNDAFSTANMQNIGAGST